MNLTIVTGICLALILNGIAIINTSKAIRNLVDVDRRLAKEIDKLNARVCQLEIDYEMSISRRSE